MAAKPLQNGRLTERRDSEQNSIATATEADPKEKLPSKGRGRLRVLYSWLGFQKGYNVPLCKAFLMLMLSMIVY
jgi:hypothetical protein